MSATKRKLGFGTATAIVATGCWAVVIACSSESKESVAAADAAGAADAAPTFDGTIAMTDSGRACVATAPKRPLLAAATKKFQPGSCTTTQVDAYVKDCLDSDGKVCSAYRSANAACAACAESTSADPAWGPVVFYENRQFYDYNYGGCIANVTGDFGESGCGAAQTRYLECRHAACVSCLPQKLPIDFAPFYACQAASATDTLCRVERDESTAACTTYFATTPKDACQAAGLAPLAYLRQLVTAFCGPSASDAGDGGD